MRPPEGLTRRLLLQQLALLVSAAAWPRTVHASLFGEENASLLAILAEMIEQVLQAVKTVEGVFETVNQLITVVNQGKTLLSHLDDIGSVVGLLKWAQSAVANLQSIDRDVTKLGYKFGAIDTQHRAVFPTRESFQAMPSNNFVATATGWNDALRESTVVAARAQTSIETLQSRATAQQKILDSSQAADGVVAQLQAVITNLALLHSDMAALETNLAAGMRVTTAWAGGQAARNDLIAEDHKRMLDGYSREDAPGAVLTELP
jgi:P-type conjugative transfer protein TrbJ